MNNIEISVKMLKAEVNIIDFTPDHDD